MHIQCFIDGACRDPGSSKPKRAAAAVVIYKNRQEIVHYARGLGDKNNNEAEYEALIMALLICSMMEIPAPTIYSDSAVVVNHTNGKWECRSVTLLPYYLAVKHLKESYSFHLIQVPRNKVAKADSLCNEILDEIEKEEVRITGLE